MIAVPHNDAVLCKRANAPMHEDATSNIVFQQEELPMYEVIAIGDSVKSIVLNVGDVIVTDAQPTKFCLEGTMLFLVRDEHIAGKVKR